MKIDFAARVEIGAKEKNDDRILVSGHILNETAESGTLELPIVAAVCDGCGGYAGGGIAAQSVLEVLAGKRAEQMLEEEYLRKVLEECNGAVLEKKSENPQYSAMCTTVAGIVCCDSRISIFHAGDSRVYRCDRWGIARMTIDHSVVQNMVDSGRLTEEEARVSPNRNIINRCIGIECPPPDIYVSRSSIGPGEKFLICSDGLWENVRDEKIREILSDKQTLSQMTEELIELALKGGCDDNISVCILASRERLEDLKNEDFVLD